MFKCGFNADCKMYSAADMWKRKLILLFQTLHIVTQCKCNILCILCQNYEKQCYKGLIYFISPQDLTNKKRSYYPSIQWVNFCWKKVASSARIPTWKNFLFFALPKQVSSVNGILNHEKRNE